MPPSKITATDSPAQIDPRRAYPGQHRVNQIFDRVATHYDIMNDLASFGLHRLWKSLMVDALRLPQDTPYRLLDLACGSGDIAIACLQRRADLDVTLIDINPAMLAQAQTRCHNSGLNPPSMLCANAAALPLPSDHFDACTIAFGIRNVADIDGALAEIYRVLEPPGHFLCLEFTPESPLGFDWLMRLHREHVIPMLGQIIIGDPEPYHYLHESIDAFPSPQRFLALLARTGFVNLRHQPLLGGGVGLFSGHVF